MEAMLHDIAEDTFDWTFVESNDIAAIMNTSATTGQRIASTSLGSN